LKKLLWVLFLVVSSNTFATTYYVCPTGSDTNPGTSIDAPLQSYGVALSKFNNTLAAELRFCRNGVFPVSFQYIFNKRCTSTLPCTISDYEAPLTPPGSLAPILQGNSSGALNFQDSGNADHDEGYSVSNLTLKGIGAGRGVFMFNDVDYVTLDNLTIDGFAVGTDSQGGNTPNAGANRSNDYLVIKNSVIRNNGGQGSAGFCNNCEYTNNRYENNGFGKAVFNHNFYFSGQTNHNITIKDNYLYKSTIIADKCQGVSLVVHGVVTDMTISGNTVIEDKATAAETCWGISVDPGYTSQELFTNIRIENNHIINVGGNGIGCASCVDSFIKNNTIFRNWAGTFTGIAIPVRAEDLIKSSNLDVSGNRFYLFNSLQIPFYSVPNTSNNLKFIIP
jgi:hypothetical protein